MSDKCDSHDKCFDGVHRIVEKLGDEVKGGFADVTKELRDGAILHKELMLKIEQWGRDHLRLEAEVTSLKQHGTSIDWKNQAVVLGRGLIEKGLLVILGMALYAAQNGYWSR